MESNGVLSFGDPITGRFKACYDKHRESIDYLCQYGDRIQRANASLIRDIALQE